jgi:hypothetical protein
MLLGTLNRAASELGKTFADPNVVLSVFIRQLGASNLLVGRRWPTTSVVGAVRDEGTCVLHAPRDTHSSY